MSRRLLAPVLLGVATTAWTAAAGAYEPPHALVRAREDYRSVAQGDDGAAKAQFGSIWRQAEVSEELSRRLLLTRVAVTAAARAIDQAEDRLLTWGVEHRESLASLIADPEQVAGPKSKADAGRRPFYMAADEWNVLHRKLGKKSPKGSAADEYVTATSLVLMELRKVADSGGNVKGRFLLSGFDRLSELDSAKELHRQTKALATAHQGGDAGAADRVKELGWGANGAPSDVVQAQGELRGYRAGAAAFVAQVEQTATAPQAAPAGGPVAANLGEPAASVQGPATGLGGAPIHQAIDAEVGNLVSPLPAGGLAGWHAFHQGLADLSAAARDSHGGALAPAGGGLSLPPGMLGAIERRLVDPPAPEDATAKRYGRILAAFTPEAKAELDRALAAGKPKEAQRIYQSITGEPDEHVKARVRALLARQRSGDQVDKALARAPSAESLIQRIPPGPAEVPPDEDYWKASPDPGELAGAAALPAVAAYLPPPPRRDGEPGGDAALAKAHADALSLAQGVAAAAAQALEEKAKAAQAEVDAHATGQRESHLDLIREAGFGPIPDSCPAGEEISLCPEKHILATHPGRCRPTGLSCDGAGVVDLSFP